jgi:uncharacterized protein (TIGR00725 family)
MTKRKITIGVIGGNTVSEKDASMAFEVGKHIAKNDSVLVCGGMGGVMEAAARGAAENGGLVVGIIPSDDKRTANPFVHIVIPTGMGFARNMLVVLSSDVLIAFPGSYGTLSEIACALTAGKTVVHLPGAWDISKIGQVDHSLFKEAFEPFQAVGIALNAIITIAR